MGFGGVEATEFVLYVALQQGGGNGQRVEKLWKKTLLMFKKGSPDVQQKGVAGTLGFLVKKESGLQRLPADEGILI